MLGRRILCTRLSHQVCEAAYTVGSCSSSSYTGAGRNKADANTIFDQAYDERVAQARRSLLVTESGAASDAKTDARQRQGFLAETIVKHLLPAGTQPLIHRIDQTTLLVELPDEKQMHNFVFNSVGHDWPGSYNKQSPKSWICGFIISHLMFDAAIPPPPNDRIMIPEVASPDPDRMLNHMRTLPSMKAQMLYITEQLSIPDSHIRLAFFICSHIEDAVGSAFPTCRVTPYGSAMNGFGKCTSDVDLQLRLDDYSGNSKTPFKFSTKHLPLPVYPDRVSKQSASYLFGYLSKLLGSIIPGPDVQLVLSHARTPIIRFIMAGVECDLSLSPVRPETSATNMTKLLWFIQEFDPRVKPLLFSIQFWGKRVGLSKVDQRMDQHKLTSFHWTLLVIHFLQHVRILPPLNQLFTTDTADVDESSGFLSSLRLVNNDQLTQLQARLAARNKADVDDLLIQFLSFYSSFDFSTTGITVRTGAPAANVLPHVGYAENPFDSTHNSFSMVGQSTVALVNEACRQVSQEMVVVPHKKQSWGLVKMCQHQFEVPVPDNLPSNEDSGEMDYEKPVKINISDYLEFASTKVDDKSDKSTATKTEEDNKSKADVTTVDPKKRIRRMRR